MNRIEDFSMGPTEKAIQLLKEIRYKINRLEMKQKLLAEEIDELWELLDTVDKQYKELVNGG